MILHQSKNNFWKNIDLNVKIDKTDIKKTKSYKQWRHVVFFLGGGEN